MKSQSLFAFALSLAAAAAAPAAAGNKGLTVDDMLAMQRISDPAVSPDGKRVAFAVRDTDLDANRGRYDIWLANVDGTDVHRATTSPENDTDPAWSPDGKYIYYQSVQNGSTQVWRTPSSGGAPEQVTKLPLDTNGFKLFPDGRILVALEVWPAAHTLADSVKLDAAAAKRAAHSKVRIYDHLLFRHWDQWEDGKFSHLFVVSPAHPTDATDLTPGLETDTPSHPFGGMADDVDISPDGKRVAYVIRNAGRENAWRTNTDVFIVPSSGNAKPTNVTAQNLAYDFLPTFSPDGKSLAITQMKRPGYEADRSRISVVDLATTKVRVLTEAWDRSAGELTWSADGKTLYTTTDNIGTHAIFAIDVATGKERLVAGKGTNTSVHPIPATDRLLYLHDSLDTPTEIWTAKLDGTDAHAITHLNDARAKAIAFGAAEQFSFKGAHGDTVYGYVVRPAIHDGKAKVPVAFLVHGGPQTSFGDHFHYRWNAEAFAGHGYGVVMIDFHGSPGYGQAFTDAINNDWAGAPYEDLMTGLDAALKKYTWLDGGRVAALGASYGGYMMNWINGHTDRFKALVVHDGNLDERMAYFDTEELWFPEWEHKGVPWENAEGYTKSNPIDYVKNWKTPTLVIHGGLDYRIPEAHGMATFTALQRKGVPSRFVEFPDENHWVLKPGNSKVWHEEVLAWLDKWAKK